MALAPLVSVQIAPTLDPEGKVQGASWAWAESLVERYRLKAPIMLNYTVLWKGGRSYGATGTIYLRPWDKVAFADLVRHHREELVEREPDTDTGCNSRLILKECSFSDDLV